MTYYLLYPKNENFTILTTKRPSKILTDFGFAEGNFKNKHEAIKRSAMMSKEAVFNSRGINLWNVYTLSANPKYNSKSVRFRI